jgi:predicted DsbA family dithiol-disulfide isomerase
MLVEIWSDVVCPWCYIGKRRFESALRQFEHADEVDVRWRSFELDPRAPDQRSGDTAAHLARKYGMSLEQARARLRSLDELAAAEGLDFRLGETTGGNTLAAHRLIHLGHEQGIGDEVKEALLHAYFVEAKAVGDADTLVEIGAQAGLARSDVVDLLESNRFTDAVRADEAEAAGLGVTGVPFFVFDRTFAVSGAQQPDVFLMALRKAWTEAPQPPVVPAVDGTASVCAGDVCDI